MADKPGSVEGQLFIWDLYCYKPRATYPDDNAKKHYTPSLFGLAPGGVYLCRMMSPYARCALTTPFHPYQACAGRLFSVALSLGSLPVDVIHHRFSVEPGLSSILLQEQQLPSHLERIYMYYFKINCKGRFFEIDLYEIFLYGS